MENQPAPDSSVAAETAQNGSAAVQEVSSTTQNVEPTKRALRVQTWKKIQENKAGVGFHAIFNRIPGFVDSDKAAQLLAETEEFKKAQNVKVNIDRALHAAKLQTLAANKTLFLPSTKDSGALFLRVDVPNDATEEQKKESLHVQDVSQHRTEISLENKVVLDMIIIGSVVVSRDGYRIGRGNGFADLDIGLLIEIGAITPNTVIATMVHDLQVVDNLPLNLFQKYDAPVDLIVTPTQVIRVEKRLPRPEGLFWPLLSERRLKIVPVLKTLKENEEKSGKVIVLKENDTDIEQSQNNRNRRRGPMRRFGRRNQRRAVSHTDTEQQQGENAERPRRNMRRIRRFNPRRRRITKSEGDQSGVEAKSQERKANPRPQRQRKNRPSQDFCIKLTNLTRDIRVKDLKSELRKRECVPLYISWKDEDVDSTKVSWRVKTWKKIEETESATSELQGILNRISEFVAIEKSEKLLGKNDGNTKSRKERENSFFDDLQELINRTPEFIGNEKAAELLAETEEFKSADNIKINSDPALQPAKLATLIENKTLYLPSSLDSGTLCVQVNVPDAATEEQKAEILKPENLSQYSNEITLENKVALDMVIIGSNVVSRDGYRIGHGNGFTDLDIGLLIEIGAITDDTIIATMVHDTQVVDNLPLNLFQKYDVPVDLIVTPTEVIYIDDDLPRPEGLFWPLISERRLNSMPILKTLKESQEKDGKIITLKENDSDVEGLQNNRNRRPHSGYPFKRGKERRAKSSNATEQQVQIKKETPPTKKRPYRRFYYKKRPSAAVQGDQSIVKEKKEETKKNKARSRRQYKNRQTRNSIDKNVEQTKLSLRIKTMKQMQDTEGEELQDCISLFSGIYCDEKTAELLAESEEFKNSHRIKVNNEPSLRAAKLKTLLANKTLYLSNFSDSKALLLQVDVPVNATEEQKREILEVEDVTQYRTEIFLEEKVFLDMIVISSVVVSRDGYRIGRGTGSTAIDIGLLIEVGTITAGTVIVTLVQDEQVVDNLPTILFKNYDVPVDLIVTPTQVIRVENRLNRPEGLFWPLISERRLKTVPALKNLKENEENSGKVIVLKESDTDTEQEQIKYKNALAASNKGRHRFNKSDADKNGNNIEKQDPKINNQRQKRRFNKDFSVKLTFDNIPRNMRNRDLKTELRKRNCVPMSITWKGAGNKCLLNYGNRNGKPMTDEDMNNVLKSLSNLSLTIPSSNASGGGGDADATVEAMKSKQVVAVNVELVKRGATNGEINVGNGPVVHGDKASRNESMDTSTVYCN